MKRIGKKLLFAITMIFTLSMVAPEVVPITTATTVEAASVKQSTVVLKPGESKEISFSTNKPQIFTMNYEISLYGNSKSLDKGTYSIKIKNSKGIVLKSDVETIKNMTQNNSWIGDVYSSGTPLPIDTYTYVVSNNSKVALSFKYNIEKFDKAMTKLSMKKTIKLVEGGYKIISVPKKCNEAFLAKDIKVNKKGLSVLPYLKSGRLVIDGIKKGTYKVTFKLENNKKFYMNVTVEAPKPYIKWYKYRLNRGEGFKNKLVNAPGKVTWSTTNKKVATVSKRGTVKTVGKGSCYVIAKCKGKSYKCKVIVDILEPNFGAVLYDYNTRGNYFTVRFKNKGKKTLYIVSGNKVEDVDYKSFDRKVSLGKKVVIKPGQTKYIHFRVRGRNTWYNYEDFTLCYKFMYDGKTYEGHTWDEDSVYKKGKSWYGTYWDEDWYEEWSLGI